jgi:DNA polymerase-3 subunit epsilon
VVLERLGGALVATHVRSRLILAGHPVDATRQDAFWLAGGRLVDWGPAPEDNEALEERTRWALTRAARAGDVGAHVPPDEIDELRIIANYLAAHPDTTALVLERGDGRPVPERVISETAAR